MTHRWLITMKTPSAFRITHLPGGKELAQHWTLHSYHVNGGGDSGGDNSTALLPQ